MLVHHLAISVFHRGRDSQIPEYGLAATTMDYTADTDPPPFSRTSDIKIVHYTLPTWMDKSKPSSQKPTVDGVHLCLERPKNPDRLATTRDIIVDGFVHLPWTRRPDGFDVLMENELRVSAQKLASGDAGWTLGQCGIHRNSSIEDIETKSETRCELSLELVLSVLRRVSYEVEGKSKPEVFTYCLELHLVARMYLQSDDKGPNRVPVPVVPFEAMKIVADAVEVIAKILMERKRKHNLPDRFVFPFNYLFLSGARDSPSSRLSWRKDWADYTSREPYRALLDGQVNKIVQEGFPVEDGVSVKVKYDPWDPFRPIFETEAYDDDR